MYSDSSTSIPLQPLKTDSNNLIRFNLWLNNRYRLIKLLGQGGFGTTFLAVDKQQDSPSFCAIKQLLQADPNHHPRALELFCQEAQRLAELGEHPQIPKLLNTFKQDEQLFIVQEWIDGWTLEEELIEGVFSEAEIRQVLQELLPVLQFLHDRQIIHRDIKPANIIRRRGSHQLVLVDFSAAKHLSTASTINTGTLIGSAEYAAPEQIRGRADFTSDLYSLGVTCLHLMTQTSPFNLYDMSEGAWKWQEYLAQPVSPALRNILYKLLQPATRRRYQSVSEVLADLDASSVQASATVYNYQTQASYRLPSEIEAFCNCRNLTSPTERMRTYFSSLFNAETKDAVALAFTGMFLFMLTCIGAMLMICLFYKIEQRSAEPNRTESSTSQTTIQQPSASLSTPPVK